MEKFFCCFFVPPDAQIFTCRFSMVYYGKAAHYYTTKSFYPTAASSCCCIIQYFLASSAPVWERTNTSLKKQTLYTHNEKKRTQKQIKKHYIYQYGKRNHQRTSYERGHGCWLSTLGGVGYDDACYDQFVCQKRSCYAWCARLYHSNGTSSYLYCSFRR